MPKFQFRISTALLLITVVALVVGWAFDRPATLESRIVGNWKHSFPGAGHWENLRFDADGTFRRELHYRVGGNILLGKYEFTNANEIRFSFEKCGIPGEELRTLTDNENRKANCRVLCSIDSGGNLLLVNLNPSVAYGKSDGWDECFIPSRNYVRGEFTFEPAKTKNGG